MQLGHFSYAEVVQNNGKEMHKRCAARAKFFLICFTFLLAVIG